MGLYHVPTIESATLVSMVKDVFLRMNLSVNKLRGQCYDGASTVMKGAKSGVAKQICDLESRAVYTHCYGHSLNLAASDTLKDSKIMRKHWKPHTKLQSSPRRNGKLKEEISCGPTPVIRLLCPTRWMVRADSLGSIITSTWVAAYSVTKDTEAKARIHGVSALIKTFYGAMLGELLP